MGVISISEEDARKIGLTVPIIDVGNEKEELKKPDEVVEFRGDIYSLQGCPNRCIKGIYYNTKVRKEVRCEYCLKKKKDIVLKRLVDKKDGKTIAKKLGIPFGYTTHNYEEKAVFKDYLINHYTKESIEQAKGEIAELYSNASGGILPKYSIVMGFPFKTNFESIVGPLLLKMYSEGLNVAPIAWADDLLRLDIREQNDNPNPKVSLQDYIEADFSVIFYGGTFKDAAFAYLLKYVSKRGYNNKPTLVVLHNSLKALNYESAESFWYTTHKGAASMKDMYLITLKKKEVEEKKKAKEVESEVKSPSGAKQPQLNSRMSNITGVK